MPSAKRFAPLALLTCLAGPVPPGCIGQPALHYVFPLAHSAPARFAAVSLEELHIIPGGSSAHVATFDADGKRLAGVSLDIGWRISPKSAAMIYSDSLGEELLVLEMARYVNGQDIRKEYFAFRGGKPVLVRLESADSSAERMICRFPNYIIGPQPKAATPADWMRMLESNDKVEVLSALVWVGAEHEEGKEPMRGWIRQAVGRLALRTNGGRLQ
jgi:hypothetical protein